MAAETNSQVFASNSFGQRVFPYRSPKYGGRFVVLPPCSRINGKVRAINYEFADTLAEVISAVERGYEVWMEPASERGRAFICPDSIVIATD